MSEPVKPPGPRAAGRPQARTRRTRAAVIDAARRLFLERGYASTTIEMVSDLADTPQATVYRLFASKLGILQAMLDVSIAGDDQSVAMADRPQVHALLADQDPRTQLTGLAALVRQVMGRVGAVHRILADAARADSAAAALLAEIARQRHEGQRRVVTALAHRQALRPDLEESVAADIVHALASPEVYSLLVLDRGWEDTHYEDWLRSILIHQLLGPDVPQRGCVRSPASDPPARLRSSSRSPLASRPDPPHAGHP